MVVVCREDERILLGDLPFAYTGNDRLLASPLHLESVRRNSGWQLADLQHSIRDCAARDAGVGRPMKSTVENILAPAVHVIPVDIVDAAISDHDFVSRETYISYYEEGALGHYRSWMRARTHDVWRVDPRLRIQGRCVGLGKYVRCRHDLHEFGGFVTRPNGVVSS